MPEFKEFSKIPRLSRDCIITEKIDGTNGIIWISEDGKEIMAGSRKRWLDEKHDNYGFHLWMTQNKEELLNLGPGYHYGEWWGLGIHRGYGLFEKRFSLFNVFKYTDKVRPKCCGIVPILYSGNFDTSFILGEISKLKEAGSVAAPGYMKPEGIIIYHTASRSMFKKTIDRDEQPKGVKDNAL